MLVGLLAVVALVAGSCSDDEQAGSGDGTTSTTEAQDGTGTADEAPTAPDSEYCAVAREISDTSSTVAEDPDTALDQLERLAAAAPEELAGDVELFLDTIRQLAEVPEDDPAALGEVLSLLIAPELTEASDAIDAYTREACGFGLDTGGS